MDATRFDGLTRLLGTSSSRRAALRLLLAATAASPGLVPVGSGARKRPARRKRKRVASSGADVSKAQCRNQCHACSPLDVRSGADLQGCDLRGLVLTKRDLSGCDLRGACLQGADLREASLDGANLDGACLRDAILAGTSLRGVSLYQATLCGANLAHADLSGSRVDAAQLACALVCNTRMPDGSLGDDDRGTSRACPACDDACLKDETCCGNECASLETDIRHCARCDNACPPPTAHATVSCGEAPDLHGRLVHDCLYTCEEGWEDCDNDFDTGCEVFTRGDANNCGGCGSRCAEGMVCCNCQCVSPGSGQCGRCSTVTSARLIRRR